mmetsp:Transcript_44877/g.106489  ORF Transcript_44877/g.106489 Transcript_44877/m.106489 type:complete len:711 (+) Transcript_44877:87-2219(+)
MSAEEEKRAARLVRLQIQQARVAKPESLPKLESNVRQSLIEQSVTLGTSLEILQAEVEKGLVIARKHAKAVQEQREKDAALAEKPRALLQELHQVISRLDEKRSELRKAAGLEDTAYSSRDAVIECVESSRSELKACLIIWETFKKEKQRQVMAPTVPQFIKEEFQKTKADLENGEKQLEEAIKAAMAAVWEDMRAKVMDDLKMAPQAIEEMERAIQKMEAAVAPFRRSARASVQEMKLLAEAAKATIDAGGAAVAEARIALQPKPEVISGLDEDTKESLNTMVRKELKQTASKHGLLERRLRRAQNLLRYFLHSIDRKTQMRSEVTADLMAASLLEAFPNSTAASIFSRVDSDADGFVDAYDILVAIEGTTTYREAKEFSGDEDIRFIVNSFSASDEGVMDQGEFLKVLAKAKPEEVLAELKPEVKARAEEMSTKIEKVREAVRDSERLVEPFRRSLKKPLAEMQDLADQAAKGLEAAEAVQARLSAEFVLVDPQLAEKVRMALLAAVAPEVRVLALRQGQLERRLHRVRNLIRIFNADIDRVKRRMLQSLRDEVVELVRRSGKTPEEVFKGLDSNGVGEIAVHQLLDSSRTSAGLDRVEDICEVWVNAKSGVTTVTQAEFQKMATIVYQAVRLTTLTDSMEAAGSKLLGTVKAGEVVEMLEGPITDPSTQLCRGRVRHRVSGVVGWTTISGSKGTIFLKECKEPVLET